MLIDIQGFRRAYGLNASIQQLCRDHGAAQAAEAREEAEGQGEKAMTRWLRFEERACETIDWLIGAGFIGLVAYSLGVF